MTERLDSARLKEVEEFLANSGYDLAKTNRLTENQQYLLPLRGHEPVQILTGEGVNDEVVTTADGHSVGFVDGLLDSLRSNSPYDYIMIYDPAKCQVKFLDEIERKDGSISRKMRAAIAKSGIKFMDAGGETNLVTQLLKENVLNPFEGLMPDRVLLEMIEKLIEDEKKRVLLIIDDAGDFIFTDQSANTAEMLPSMNRVINRSLINSLAKKLQGYPGSKIVLIDRRGKLASLKGNNLEIRHIGTPERAELQPLVKEKITSDKWKMGVELARGISLNKVRRVLAQHQGSEVELLAKLKKFKEAEVSRLSGGAVKCNMDEYTREMVAMAEDEAIFWDELATILKDGQKNELLPQGVLLVGPPGTGKSIRAKYLASSMGVPYLELNNISSSGLRGIKEDRVRQAFEAAIAVKPCILFIDEIDKYLPRTEGQRSGVGAENDDSEVAAYIQRMMDSKEMNGVVIVGAGNNPDQMNEAMLRSGRFGLRVAVLSPKTIEEKVSVFKAVIKQLDQTRHLLINDQLLEKFLSHEKLQDATGADYGELIRRSALKQSVQKGKRFWAVLCQELNIFKLRKNTKIAEMEERSREMHTAPFELNESKTSESPTPIDVKGIFDLAETADLKQLEEDKQRKAELVERQEKAKLAAIAIEEEQEKKRLVALAIKEEPFNSATEAGQVADQNTVQPKLITKQKEVQKTNNRELSPENATKLLATLKKRFEAKNKHYENPERIKWEDVQRALENSPEKLWSLHKMEKTGGKPDVVKYNKKTGEYIFMDCSAESPTGRRNCVYDREGEEILKRDYPRETYNGNAVSMAALMGVDILNEKEYRDLQTKGEFDKDSWSWIKTPADKRKTGVALFGIHDGSYEAEARVTKRRPSDRFDNGAWRGLLTVSAPPTAQAKETQQTNSRELSPEIASILLATLKKRLETKKKHYKNPKGIKWEDVQRALENSQEKLWSLNEMERTDGEPDVMGWDEKTGEYIFMDCSAESPTGRRNCVYDREGEEILKRDYPTEKYDGSALSRAALMGISLLSESEYRKLQTKGEFDKNSWSWIKTPVDKRKAGVALWGGRYQDDYQDGVHVNEDCADDRGDTGAFRASLRVSAPIAQAKETQQTDSRELSPEIASILLATLKKRFETEKKHYKNPEGIKWENIQRALENSPEKLWSLNEMERTGGAPDVVKYDKKTGEYIFMDCSPESPTHRRNCVYDREGEKRSEDNPDGKTCCNGNAISRAAEMSVNLLTKDEYIDLLTIGKFDQYTWGWLMTPVDIRKFGEAHFGGQGRGSQSSLRTSVGWAGVAQFGGRESNIGTDFAHSHDEYRQGFRVSLRVSGNKPLAVPIAQAKETQRTNSRELSPEIASILLATLKDRFETENKHYKNPEGIKWEDIQRALENSPEKLWSLHKMERTGGEPDVIEYDKKAGEYIFMDCSAESPKSRWDCVYDKKAEAHLNRNYPGEPCNSNAERMASSMGIEILDENQYQKLQSKGEFDKKTLNWLKSPVDKETFGHTVVHYARFGGRKGSKVYTRTDVTHDTDTDHISWGPLGENGNGNPRERGFRGLLTVSAPIAQAKETQQTDSRELSPEIASILLATLKKRFEARHKHYESAERIKWKDIQRALENSPEKLWSLNEMEKTDGEPDVAGYDDKTGEYIFVDFSPETPKGRRNYVYDREAEKFLRKNHSTIKCDGNAINKAALMGVNLLTVSEYRELQTRGNFDGNGWSWIKTPVEERKKGVALCGGHAGGMVLLGEDRERHPFDRAGFRASLRVSTSKITTKTATLSKSKEKKASIEHKVIGKLDFGMGHWYATIGRDPICDIVIDAAQNWVGGVHLKLFHRDGDPEHLIHVTDSHSENGTYIKNKRLKRRAEYLLKINKHIVLGNMTIYLRENGEVVMVTDPHMHE